MPFGKSGMAFFIFFILLLTRTGRCGMVHSLTGKPCNGLFDNRVPIPDRDTIWKYQMNIATQLEHVMSYIWGDTRDDYPATIKACASYVKTHGRRNHENVWDVIDILFRDNVRTIKQRPFGEYNPGDASNYPIDVQFDDESQIIVICAYGIGNAVELV
jgi:hypothetical protein